VLDFLENLTMLFKIITIFFDKDKACFIEDELNQFCLNKKVKSYHAEFFKLEDQAYWTVFIAYEIVLEAKNERETSLSEEEKLLLQKFKEWRKQKAEEMGFPVYIIATNKQLELIIKNKPMNYEALKRISGFGHKKIESYGKEIIAIVKSFYEVTK
jgi:superfamily II DNA helicase RecQ